MARPRTSSRAPDPEQYLRAIDPRYFTETRWPLDRPLTSWRPVMVRAVREHGEPFLKALVRTIKRTKLGTHSPPDSTSTTYAIAYERGRRYYAANGKALPAPVRGSARSHTEQVANFESLAELPAVQRALAAARTTDAWIRDFAKDDPSLLTDIYKAIDYTPSSPRDTLADQVRETLAPRRGWTNWTLEHFIKHPEDRVQSVIRNAEHTRQLMEAIRDPELYRPQTPDELAETTTRLCALDLGTFAQRLLLIFQGMSDRHPVTHAPRRLDPCASGWSPAAEYELQEAGRLAAARDRDLSDETAKEDAQALLSILDRANGDDIDALNRAYRTAYPTRWERKNGRNEIRFSSNWRKHGPPENYMRGPIHGRGWAFGSDPSPREAARVVLLATLNPPRHTPSSMEEALRASYLNTMLDDDDALRRSIRQLRVWRLQHQGSADELAAADRVLADALSIIGKPRFPLRRHSDGKLWILHDGKPLIPAPREDRARLLISLRRSGLTDRAQLLALAEQPPPSAPQPITAMSHETDPDKRMVLTFAENAWKDELRDGVAQTTYGNPSNVAVAKERRAVEALADAGRVEILSRRPRRQDIGPWLYYRLSRSEAAARDLPPQTWTTYPSVYRPEVSFDGGYRWKSGPLSADLSSAQAWADQQIGGRAKETHRRVVGPWYMSGAYAVDKTGTPYGMSVATRNGDTPWALAEDQPGMFVPLPDFIGPAAAPKRGVGSKAKTPAPRGVGRTQSRIPSEDAPATPLAAKASIPPGTVELRLDPGDGITLHGDTKPHREAIKRAGGWRWSRAQSLWYRPRSRDAKRSALPPLAESLRAQGVPVLLSSLIEPGATPRPTWVSPTPVSPTPAKPNDDDDDYTPPIAWGDKAIEAAELDYTRALQRYESSKAAVMGMYGSLSVNVVPKDDFHTLANSQREVERTRTRIQQIKSRTAYEQSRPSPGLKPHAIDRRTAELLDYAANAWDFRPHGLQSTYLSPARGNPAFTDSEKDLDLLRRLEGLHKIEIVNDPHAGPRLRGGPGSDVPYVWYRLKERTAEERGLKPPTFRYYPRAYRAHLFWTDPGVTPHGPGNEAAKLSPVLPTPDQARFWIQDETPELGGHPYALITAPWLPDGTLAWHDSEDPLEPPYPAGAVIFRKTPNGDQRAHSWDFEPRARFLLDLPDWLRLRDRLRSVTTWDEYWRASPRVAPARPAAPEPAPVPPTPAAPPPNAVSIFDLSKPTRSEPRAEKLADAAIRRIKVRLEAGGPLDLAVAEELDWINAQQRTVSQTTIAKACDLVEAAYPDWLPAWARPSSTTPSTPSTPSTSTPSTSTPSTSTPSTSTPSRARALAESLLAARDWQGMPPGLPVLREIAEGALELDQQKRANVGALAGSNDDPRVQREVIELAVILDELRAATAPSVPAPSLRPANTSPKADRWADSTLLALLPAGDWYIERVDDVPKAAELVIGTRTGDLRTRKRAVKTAAEALRAQGVRVRARASGDSLAVYSPSQTRPAQLAKQAETATSRAEARRARKADKEAAKQAAAAKRRETAELKRSQAAAKRLARQKTPPRIFARPVGIDAVTGERVPLGTPGSSPSRGLYYVARPARGEPLTYVPVPAVDLAPTHTRHAIKRSRSDHYRALAHQAPISLPALPRDAAPPDGSDPAELARHQRSRELWALADQIDRATPNAPADARAILRRRSRSLRRWAEHPELVPPTSCSTGEDGCAFAAIARDVAKLTADPSSYSLTHAPTAEPEGLLTMPGAVAGDSALVAVPSARSAPSLIPARYVAVDAETLIPSHNPEGFDPRPDYPDNTQERRYERDPAEKLKVTTIAQQLVPELLANTNAGATDGTPIVTPSGVVLSGNGRTMGLQLHYRGGRTKMAEWLRDHAAQFGLDPAQLASIPRPIVVRVIDPSETAGGLSRLVRDFNVSLTQALAEDDETQAQARQLPPELPQILADGDAGDGLLPYLAHPRSKPLVAALERSGWITRSTRNRQLDPSGVLSLPARKAVAALITASVATDAALASPVLKKALDRSAVYWLIAAASGPTWDMRVPLSRATADYLAMKHDGACLLQWQQQQTLGTSRSSEGDPAAELLLEILDLAAARPVVFAKIAEAFARAAAEARGGGGLFGPPSTDPLTALQDAALSAGVKPASALSRRRCRKK